MPAGFHKLISRLDEEYQALGSGYAEESLHQFRVILRRLRSLLRHNTSHKVRNLRCQLGKLSRMTNAARDWDTLVSRARASLSARDFAIVRSLLEERQAESHLPVLQMLQSESWPDVRRALKKVLKVHGAALAVELRGDAELSWARQRVSRARRAAQARGTDRARHKLRIAIKDLRYRLTMLPADHRTAAIISTLKLSKRLQESLGVWHDSVVHLQLVQELCEGAAAQGQRELLAILDAWCRQMAREAQDEMDSVSAELAATGGMLLD